MRQVFDRLDPPPGGLARLNTRLDSAPRDWIQSGGRWAFAAALAAVSVLLWSNRGGPEDGSELVFAMDSRPALMRLGVLDLPASAVSVAPDRRDFQALLEIPTTGEGVMLFLFDGVPESSSAVGPEEGPRLSR